MVDASALMVRSLNERLENFDHATLDSAKEPGDVPSPLEITSDDTRTMTHDTEAEPFHYTIAPSWPQNAYPGYTGKDQKESLPGVLRTRDHMRWLREAFFLPWDGFFRDLLDPTREVLVKSPLKRAEDAAWYGCDELGQIWRFADMRRSPYGKVKR